MPPSGVSMSTFFSSPCAFFFTFTLHAGRSSTADRAMAASRALAARNCRLLMLRPSIGELRPALDSGAALGDVGNADRQVAVNRNLAEQCFHSADLRNCGI